MQSSERSISRPGAWCQRLLWKRCILRWYLKEESESALPVFGGRPFQVESGVR